jgi:hypothetical protein
MLLLSNALGTTPLRAQNPQTSASERVTKIPPILCFVDSNSIIGRISEGQVFIGPGEAAYFVLGNTLYEGPKPDRDRILFLMGTTELFPKRPELVFFANGEDVAYSWRKGRLSLGRPSEYEELEIMLEVRDLSDKDVKKPGDRRRYGIYDWADGAWLGTVASPYPIRPAELIACLHLYVLHYDLDRRVNDRLMAMTDMGASGESPMGDSLAMDSMGVDSLGTDQPMGGRIYLPYGGPDFEWIWDGEYLKPAIGLRAEDEWRYDGRYITPVFGNTREQWQWDETILKPAWSANPEMQWTWQNGTLRPNQEWRYVDGRVRLTYNPDPRRTWEVEGDVPLPLIAMVVLGFANR